MTTVRAFLTKIRAIFSSFWKREGEDSPPPPSSYAPELCALPFQELLLQYVNPEISKLQSPDGVFSTVCVRLAPYFRTSIGAKNTVFSLFLQPVTKTHFPDHFLILPRNTMRLDIPHYKNIYKCNTKSSLRRWILPSKTVCFSLVFTSRFLFVSSQIFWCKLVFIHTD